MGEPSTTKKAFFCPKRRGIPIAPENPSQQTMKSLRTILLVSLTAVLGIGAVALWKLRPQTTPTLSASLNASPVSAPSNLLGPDQQAEQLRYPWKAGESALYTVKYVVSVSGGAAGEWEIEGNEGQRTAITGQLHLVVLDTTPSSITIACQAADVSVTTDGRRRSMLESLFNNTAQIVHLSPDGRLQGRFFPERLGSEDRALLTSMTPLEWALSEGPGWQTRETDSLGTVIAHYHRDPESGIMSKTRRLADASSSGTAETTGALQLRHSAYQAQLGTCWLAWLEGTEDVDFVVNRQRVGSIHSEVRLEQQASAAPLPTELTHLLQRGIPANYTAAVDAVGVAANSGSASERERLARLRHHHGQVPYETAFEAFVSAFEQMSEPTDMLPAVASLRDWLIVHPGQAPQLAETLRHPDLPNELTAPMVHALALAGRETAEAQESLAGILEDREDYPDHTVIQAIVASGDLSQIQTERLSPALWEIASAPKSDGSEAFLWSDAALFAIGNLAHDNPDIGETLATSLEDRLTQPEDYAASDLVVALQSLANGKVANDSLLEASAHLTQHEDSGVRAASLAYLNRVAPQDATPLIHALDDADPSVRAQALDALESPESLSAEATQALHAQLARMDLGEGEREHITRLLAHQP